MAKKYKVKTIATINRHPIGSTIELDEATANHLAKINYVEIIEEVKPSTKKTLTKQTQTKKKDDKK